MLGKQRGKVAPGRPQTKKNNVFNTGTVVSKAYAGLVIAVAAFTGISQCAGPTPAALPLGPLLGSVLDSIGAEVESVIQKAGTEGQILTGMAASRVDLALSNVESAFAEDLNTSIDQVDEAALRSVANLQSLTDSLANNSAEILNTTIDSSQQLINSLPFTNKNPQVREYTPQYVSGSEGDTINISVAGNFYWAMEEDKKVELKVGEATYAANEVTTNRVGFSVPSSTFTASPSGYSRVSMELTAPYEKGSIFPKSKVGVFRLAVTSLPTHPIKKLTLTNAVTVTGSETIDRTVPSDGTGWRVNSRDTCDDDQDKHVIGVTSGWSIVPGSPTVHYIKRGPSDRGEASITHADHQGFIVEGKTEEACFAGISHNSGDIIYYVTYQETRTTTSVEDRPIDLLARAGGRLQWGTIISEPVERDQWVIHAELWNGVGMTVRSTDTSNQFLKIVDEGNNVKVSLIAPSRIGDVS